MTIFKYGNLFNRQQSLRSSRDFSRFYESAHLNVFRYMMVLCSGDQTEAEDITADAFLRAWDGREKFLGSEAEAVRWVIAIARNALIDRRRSETRAPLDTEWNDTFEDTIPGDDTKLEDILIHEEQLQFALEAIHQLPFRQRDALTLRYLMGWRVQEIAAHLNLPENTISVDLRRALKKTQEQLVPKGANDEI